MTSAEEGTFCSPTTCCQDNCHLAGGQMTITTTGGSAMACQILIAIENYFNEYNGDISGLPNAYFIGSDSSFCDNVDSAESVSNVEGLLVNDRDSTPLWRKALWYIVAVVLLLICFAIIICGARLRNRRLDSTDKELLMSDDFDSNSDDSCGSHSPKNLNENHSLENGNENHSLENGNENQMIGLKRRGCETIDVKYCQSSSCVACNAPEVKFVR